MYYAVFEGTQMEGKGALAEQFYKTLTSILYKFPGFVSETGFGSPHVERREVLISVWEDEESMNRWRNESTHLSIQGKASRGIFHDYHIRLGPELDPNSTGRSSSNDASQMILLYFHDNYEQTPEDDIFSLVDSVSTTGLQSEILGSSVYIGQQTLWISLWKSQEGAMKFANSLSRSPGDDVKLVRVRRDYTKSRRKDAPNEIAGSC